MIMCAVRGINKTRILTSLKKKKKVCIFYDGMDYHPLNISTKAADVASIITQAFPHCFSHLHIVLKLNANIAL